MGELRYTAGDHTVEIDGQFFHASNVQLSEPFSGSDWVETKIHNGRPVFHESPMVLRQMSFDTIIFGDIVKVRKRLEKLHRKIKAFVSIFIGAFDAIITLKIEYQDATVNETKVSFEIQEV